jgi:AcrR family transcriptional regulator
MALVDLRRERVVVFPVDGAMSTSRLLPDDVLGVQRARLLAATFAVVEDTGYRQLTVAHVINRARVSRKTFYDTFCDREDCYLAALRLVHDQASGRAREAYLRGADWRGGLRSAVAELLVLMDAEPALARMYVVDALAGGERIMQFRGAVMNELAQVVDRGRRQGGGTRVVPGLTAEGIVGGIFAILRSRLSKADGPPLTSLLGQLMSMIVLPYLGSRAAGRELSSTRTPVRVSRTSGELHGSSDPMAGLKLRLTYRTVRVLMIIGGRPGASNREVAEGSGVGDQGQISKLLSRLSRLELIENRGAGQAKGLSNEWHLTERGAALERATRGAGALVAA